VIREGVTAGAGCVRVVVRVRFNVVTFDGDGPGKQGLVFVLVEVCVCVAEELLHFGLEVGETTFSR